MFVMCGRDRMYLIFNNDWAALKLKFTEGREWVMEKCDVCGLDG